MKQLKGFTVSFTVDKLLQASLAAFIKMESIQTVSDTNSQSPSLDSTTGTSSPSTCNYTQSLLRSSAKKGYSCTKVNFSSPIPQQTATQWLRPAWTPRMLMSFPAKLRCLRVLFSFNASASTWRSRITAESGHGDIFTNPKNTEP